MCPGNPETQVSWADPQQGWAGQGGDSAPLLCRGETPSAELPPALASPIEERPVGMSPSALEPGGRAAGVHLEKAPERP